MILNFVKNTVLSALFCVTCFIGMHLVYMPDYDGQIHLHALNKYITDPHKDKIEIYTDVQTGIPHIKTNGKLVNALFA